MHPLVAVLIVVLLLGGFGVGFGVHNNMLFWVVILLVLFGGGAWGWRA